MHLQQLELRDVKFQTRYMEGATFVNGMYTGYLSVKNGIYERALGAGPRGGASPYKTFLSIPLEVSFFVFQPMKL